MEAMGIDRAMIAAVKAREDAAFVRTHGRTIALWERGKAVMPNGVPMSWHRTSFDHPPVYVDEGRGSHFRDVDGNDYVDFNIADISMFGGYAPPPVVEAIARRAAAGTQFLLPSEDAIWVAEELGRRFGLPQWQFTVSATHANTEAIRVARVLTGREKVLMFDGKYHGHLDEALIELRDGRQVPGEAGLPSGAVTTTVLVPFNDPDAVARALDGRDIALVLTEPAMTNEQGLILPDPGFHDALRDLTRATGTLLGYDETHTQIVGPQGLVGRWQLTPDILTIGKSIAGGVPLGAYGMTPEVADVLERPAGDDEKPTVATGGTLFGNPLSMAAAHATLEQVLTLDAYAHTQSLGARLADGLEKVVRDAGLPWSVHRFWARSGLTFAPTLPRDATEAHAHFDVPLRRLIRIYLANRGVWDAIVGAGPTCSVPATPDDVDAYVGAVGDLVGELTA
jgi:glutamate-1-semialdehyde 2,1-aminomutase